MLHKHLGSPPIFGVRSVLFIFLALCSIFCFICLHPVSCVLDVASVSGLSILDYPFSFL
jgi:hypothetical protein